MIASPCKADLIIEKVPCNCQAKLALKPSNSDEQPVYELRQSRYNKDYWIPTKGVINNPGYDEKVYSTVSSTITSNIQTPYAYSPYGANFASVQQSTTYEFVTSTGGDDSRATIQCHDQGLFGDSLYDEEYTKNECVVVSLQKEMYDTYNDGYNYCYMRDPTSKYFAQGALLAAQIALDHAIVTGAAALALPSGGATVAVGMGGLALSGIAFHWATESIAENYKWPKGDKK